MNIQAGVAKSLLQVKAVKLDVNVPFTWASGMLSPIYCDNRVVLSHPEVRTFIKQAFIQQAKAFSDCDVIAGVATGGIPFGALIAEALNKPFVYIRSAAKGHGRQNLIEGDLPPHSNVLVIEDLVSTGGSVLKAVDALEDAGAKVKAVLAVFSYNFPKATTAFEERGIVFESLTDYDALVLEAIKSGYITQQDKATLMQWRENPDQWGALYA